MRKEVLAPVVIATARRVELAEKSYAAIRRDIGKLAAEYRVGKNIPASVAKNYRRLRKYHTDRFNKIMRMSLGVRYRVGESAVAEDFLGKVIKGNVDLIKTIPKRYHERLIADIGKLSKENLFDQAALKKTLKDAYGSAGYNLRRLTRDQTSKAMGGLNRLRQKEVGIEAYVWGTSLDERVRPTHREKNGLQFEWDKPPPDTGHPGNDVLCRCVASGIVVGGASAKRRAKAATVAKPPEPVSTPRPTPRVAPRVTEKPPKSAPVREAQDIPVQPLGVPEKSPAEIKEIIEEIAEKGGRAESGRQDRWLKKFADKVWGDQTNVVLSGEEFKKVASPVMFRGVKKASFVKKNIKGQWTGTGEFGNGMYFGKGDSLCTAYGYIGGEGEGWIWVGKILPDAKVVKYDDLHDLWRGVKSSGKYSKAEIAFFEDDIGRFAAARGYDVLEHSTDYVVVLNQRKLAIDARYLPDGEFGERMMEGGKFKAKKFHDIVAEENPEGRLFKPPDDL